MGDQLSFEGRVAIVTGAGRGMGREHALLLARRGASIVVNDAGVDMDGSGSSEDPARSVVDEIRRAGGNAVANFDDVREPKTGDVLVTQALDTFGRLDIVINNAGILRASAFAEQSDDDLTHTVEVHLYGTARVARAAWPHLTAAGYGRIVNTTSSGTFGIADNSSYAAAKAAIFGLTRTLALEGEEPGIAVNCIAPAGWTRMAIASAADDLMTPEMWEFAEQAMPPQADAAVVAYLAHESCPLTGEVLSYSGGRLARWVLSETEGIEVGADLTPEQVMANLERIMDNSTSHLFRSADELVQYSQQKMLANR